MVHKFQILSNFHIKLLAIIFMVFDHVGLAMVSFIRYNPTVYEVADVFRSIGRLAMPLFVFMIVEGVIHTKSIKKYLLRLGIMATFISIILGIVSYVDFGINTSGIAGAGNIFLDLFLIALSIFLLKQDNKWLKPLVILPVVLSVISFSVKCFEYGTKNMVLWYPSFLYLQYDWLSVVLGIGFYLAYKGADLYVDSTYQYTKMDKEMCELNGNYRLIVNIISAFVVALMSVLYYLYKYIYPEGVFWDANLQLLAIISGAFILLYNGKRGYNAKWFQYGVYLFYPVHIGIIALIFILITGGF